MTATDTICDLCAALDDGDDAVLPILADALEEASDPRAEGLRRIDSAGWLPAERLGVPGWWWTPQEEIFGLPPAEWRRLQVRRPHDTRSAAYLALARALSEE